MTPQQPQPDYLLISKQELELFGSLNDIGIDNHINFLIERQPYRKAPHTSSTTKTCMCDKYSNCTDCQQHDTAIRNATLDEVKQYADTCIWIDDDCCPGKMNDGDGSDCDGCSYVDYPNNADICEKIESLRSTKEQPHIEQFPESP